MEESNEIEDDLETNLNEIEMAIDDTKMKIQKKIKRSKRKRVIRESDDNYGTSELRSQLRYLQEERDNVNTALGGIRRFTKEHLKRRKLNKNFQYRWNKEELLNKQRHRHSKDNETILVSSEKLMQGWSEDDPSKYETRVTELTQKLNNPDISKREKRQLEQFKDYYLNKLNEFDRRNPIVDGTRTTGVNLQRRRGTVMTTKLIGGKEIKLKRSTRKIVHPTKYLPDEGTRDFSAVARSRVKVKRKDYDLYRRFIDSPEHVILRAGVNNDLVQMSGPVFTNFDDFNQKLGGNKYYIQNVAWDAKAEKYRSIGQPKKFTKGATNITIVAPERPSAKKINNDDKRFSEAYRRQIEDTFKDKYKRDALKNIKSGLKVSMKNEEDPIFLDMNDPRSLWTEMDWDRASKTVNPIATNVDVWAEKLGELNKMDKASWLHYKNLVDSRAKDRIDYNMLQLKNEVTKKIKRDYAQRMAPLMLIQDRIKKTGAMPTVDEMAQMETGYSMKNVGKLLATEKKNEITELERQMKSDEDAGTATDKIMKAFDRVHAQLKDNGYKGLLELKKLFKGRLQEKKIYYSRIKSNLIRNYGRLKLLEFNERLTFFEQIQNFVTSVAPLDRKRMPQWFAEDVLSKHKTEAQNSGFSVSKDLTGATQLESMGYDLSGEILDTEISSKSPNTTPESDPDKQAINREIQIRHFGMFEGSVISFPLNIPVKKQIPRLLKLAKEDFMLNTEGSKLENPYKSKKEIGIFHTNGRRFKPPMRKGEVMLVLEMKEIKEMRPRKLMPDDYFSKKNTKATKQTKAPQTGKPKTVRRLSEALSNVVLRELDEIDASMGPSVHALLTMDIKDILKRVMEKISKRYKERKVEVELIIMAHKRNMLESKWAKYEVLDDYQGRLEGYIEELLISDDMIGKARRDLKRYR